MFSGRRHVSTTRGQRKFSFNDDGPKFDSSAPFMNRYRYALYGLCACEWQRVQVHVSRHGLGRSGQVRSGSSGPRRGASAVRVASGSPGDVRRRGDANGRLECWDVNVSSPATFGPGQYLPASRTTMYGRCLRSAAVSARAVRGMERRRVGRSTAETHAGCRSPNSREGWQLVLKTRTEERASAFNSNGRGSLWKSLDSTGRCGMFLIAKTGTVIEYSLGT
jgi:hypothetical protein